jgi:hypothetical protein
MQRGDWWKKVRPRTRQWIFCLVCEVVIVAALAAQCYAFQKSMHTLLQRQVCLCTVLDAFDWTGWGSVFTW